MFVFGLLFGLLFVGIACNSVMLFVFSLLNMFRGGLG